MKITLSSRNSCTGCSRVLYFVHARCVLSLHVEPRGVGPRSRTRCRSVNWLFRKFPEARCRNLQLHTPIIVSFWPQARLIQEEVSNMTYGETYELTCARAGKDPDRPILHFKEKIHHLQNTEPSSALPPTISGCRIGPSDILGLLWLRW
jgi:hypothetical protein